MYRSVSYNSEIYSNNNWYSTSTINNMTVENETENSSSSGMISTTEKKYFIDLISLDGKITTTKAISIRKPNIDDGNRHE